MIKLGDPFSGSDAQGTFLMKPQETGLTLEGGGRVPNQQIMEYEEE